MNLQTAQTPKHLSFAEEQSLNQKIQNLEDAKDGVELKNAQGVTTETKDPKAINAQLAHLKKIKEAQTVERAVGAERDKLEKEEALLRARLDPKMSWDEYSMTQRKHGMRYQRLVQQIGKWNSDQQYQTDMKRWKYVRRRLDPDDPNVSNVMHLFKE